jgi:uncharacterized RDD family membrane protein YckC
MTATAQPERRVARSADDGVVTGEAVELDIRPASAVMRAGGAALDMLLTYALIVLSLLVAANLALDAAAMQAVAVSVLVVCIVVLPTAVETATHGRSLGKLAMGLRVVRDDGGATGFRHAFIRALVGVIEIYMTFGGLAILVGMLNPSSKRIGDLLAGTHGQVERVPKLRIDPFGVPAPLVGWAATADIGRLPEPLERRLAAFFRNAPHLVPGSRARLAASLAAETAPYVSPVPDAPAELFLAAVVALRRERDAAALALEARRMASLAPQLTARPNGFPER